MAKVQLADIIEPSVFVPYSVERSAELSRLVQSGIVANDPEFDELASGAGRTVNMPFWKDLGGESEELSDTGALTPDKISADQDVAVKHFRGKAWSANDLVKHVAGSDPMAMIGDLVAGFWTRDQQKKVLLPSLQGIFATALAATHVYDVADETGNDATAAEKIGSDTIIEAAGLLGDHWDSIVAIAMHSVPFKTLQKLNLIDTIKLEDQNITIHMFLGREVIVDDGMPVVAGGTYGFKYTSYLFGRGSVGLGTSNSLDVDEAIETDRDALGSDDILISRRHFIMHPRGVAFTGTAAGSTPTQTELETGGNWTKKWGDKHIPVIKLVTNG